MKVKVNLRLGYEIEIEKGLVLEKGLPEGFVISDTNLGIRYKKLIRGESFIIEAEEQSKTIKTYLEILEELEKFENVYGVVAFGGGVVEDVAGFVASTYKRGISLVQVPTSLLAMVDRSIGGKNGINLGKIKNKIGTIYQPEKVLVDPLFLETLPYEEFKNGLAEVIKYGFIFGKPDLRRLEREVSFDDRDLGKIIFDCCKVKAKVVEKDERDKSYRHVLNFGHTIGHSIELLYGLRHGEAVSIGMIKEAKLGKVAGFLDEKRVEELERVLRENELPVEFPADFDTEEVLEIMMEDKKGRFVFSFDEQHYNVLLDEKIVRDFLKNDEN